ncbi:MAG TPA: TadE/TadG family type IV pilus assembly protein [Gaiellaceae bacterium]|nr:TadE/TadG family type IV pilus assembly protein [Gaiellaceae bacterium]
MNVTALKRDETGQAMVEFTMILPILLVVVLGIIQFGILFNNYVTLTDAVRAGARMASVSRDDADPVGAATAAVRNSATDLDQSNLNITVTSGWTAGGDVTVTATYPYSISLLGVVVSSGTLTSKTTERVE